MNVIVSNKQKSIIDNANIDAIKDFTGLFNVDDLIAKFKNYFFSKMILDVTSVENFTSREVLQKLVDGIGSDRLIILLPETPPPPNEFKRMLIDLNIYNFSNNINDVVKMIDNPNTYETALKGMDDAFYNNDGYVDNSIKGLNNDNNNQFDEVNDSQIENSDSFNNSPSLQDAMESFNVKEDIDARSINDLYNATDDDVSKNNEYNYDKSYDINGDSHNVYNDNENEQENNNDAYNIPNLSNLYNITNKNEDNLSEDSSNIGNDYSNDSNKPKSNYVFLNMGGIEKIKNDQKRIIGFRNVTEHAGSTSLIYMILKTLIEKYKKDALAVEVNSDDFKLFMNNRMIKVPENEIREYLASRFESVILVDLNNCIDDDFCDEIIYLVEPSTIKLNKLMLNNRNAFNELIGKRVVLNKSLLSSNDVSLLSNEARINFMYNMAPLNDRINNDGIINFINVLGLK